MNEEHRHFFACKDSLQNDPFLQSKSVILQIFEIKGSMILQRKKGNVPGFVGFLQIKANSDSYSILHLHVLLLPFGALTKKELAFNPAVELSYLSEEQQRNFLEAMDYSQATPSLSQAQRIKKLAQNPDDSDGDDDDDGASGGCTLENMCSIMFAL